MSRIRWVIGPILVAAFVAACSTPPASQSPSVTPGVSPSAPGPTASPTTGPTPSPSPPPELIAGFGADDILQVDVNGLAVRAAPFTTSPLAVGYRLGGDRIGPVRLDEGAYVSVDLGPLVIGDTTWYRVWPADNAELHVSTILWDTKNDGPNPIEPGWIAAAAGDDEYVSLFRASEPQDYFPLLVSGIGNFESEPMGNFDLFLLQWAYTIDEQPAPCEFEVTMATEDGDDSLVVVDSSTIGAFEEGVNPIGAGDGNPTLGGSGDPLLLQVRSGCEWTLRLEVQAHD